MRLALILLLALFGTPVLADKGPGQRFTSADKCPSLFMASIYVAQALGEEFRDDCPPVIYHTDSALAQGKVADTLTYQRRGVGFYPVTGAILLPISLNLGDTADFSLLVQQVAHYYLSSGNPSEPLTCQAELVAQALQVQGQYLRDNGLDRRAQDAFMSAKFRGTCHLIQPVN